MINLTGVFVKAFGGLICQFEKLFFFYTVKQQENTEKQQKASLETAYVCGTMSANKSV